MINDPGEIDFDELSRKVDASTTMVLIQRSRGYSLRKSLTIDTIKEIVKTDEFYYRNKIFTNIFSFTPKKTIFLQTDFLYYNHNK